MHTLCCVQTHCRRLKNTGKHSGMEAMTPESSSDLHSRQDILENHGMPDTYNHHINTLSNNPPQRHNRKGSTIKERSGCIIEKVKEGEKAGGGQTLLDLPSSRDTVSLAGRGSATKNWEPPDCRRRSSRDKGI